MPMATVSSVVSMSMRADVVVVDDVVGVGSSHHFSTREIGSP
jgi:hypothetical protein